MNSNSNSAALSDRDRAAKRAARRALGLTDSSGGAGGGGGGGGDDSDSGDDGFVLSKPPASGSAGTASPAPSAVTASGGKSKRASKEGIKLVVDSAGGTGTAPNSPPQSTTGTGSASAALTPESVAGNRRQAMRSPRLARPPSPPDGASASAGGGSSGSALGGAGGSGNKKRSSQRSSPTDKHVQFASKLNLAVADDQPTALNTVTVIGSSGSGSGTGSDAPPPELSTPMASFAVPKLKLGSSGGSSGSRRVRTVKHTGHHRENSRGSGGSSGSRAGSGEMSGISMIDENGRRVSLDRYSSGGGSSGGSDSSGNKRLLTAVQTASAAAAAAAGGAPPAPMLGLRLNLGSSSHKDSSGSPAFASPPPAIIAVTSGGSGGGGAGGSGGRRRSLIPEDEHEPAERRGGGGGGGGGGGSDPQSTSPTHYTISKTGTLKTKLFEIRPSGFNAVDRHAVNGSAAAKLRAGGGGGGGGGGGSSDSSSRSGGGDIPTAATKNQIGAINADSIVCVSILGKGAGGVVWKARHKTSGKLLALKCIDISEQSKRSQLLNELHHLYTTSCPYIVAFYGAFYQAGTTRLALEYMDRGSLQTVLKHGPLHEAVLKSIAKQLCFALQYLHSHKYLHRDLKPGNILVQHTVCDVIYLACPCGIEGCGGLMFYRHTCVVLLVWWGVVCLGSG